MTINSSNRGEIIIDFPKGISLDASYSYGPSGSYGMGPKRSREASFRSVDLVLIRREEGRQDIRPGQVDARLKPFDALFESSEYGVFANRVSIANWISLVYGLATVLKGDLSFEPKPYELDGPLGEVVDRNFDFFADSKLWQKFVKSGE